MESTRLKQEELIISENQKIIVSLNTDLAKALSPYSKQFNLALKSLSGNAFKIWVYLVQKNEKIFGLSRVECLKHTGMSKNTYLKGVSELIEKGFLIQKDKKDNSYYI